MPKKPDSKALKNLAAQHERVSSSLSGGGAILAVDYGAKHCGLALAPDGATGLALKVVSPLALETEVAQLLKLHQVQTIVFGLPVSVGGQENQLCEQIRQLAQAWQQRWAHVTVALVNEQFSTSATLSPDQTRIDDLAALQILEFYLASQR